MQVIFDALPKGVGPQRYEGDLSLRWWTYKGERERWVEWVPDTSDILVPIMMAADPNQKGWEEEAVKWVAQVVRTTPFGVKALLVVVDYGGEGFNVGFLGASEVTIQDTNSRRMPHWVLDGVIEGLNGAYAALNLERNPSRPLTAWQRILES